MSEPPPPQPPPPVQSFLQGVGNVAAFVGEAMLAVLKVAIGRWPQPSGERRRRPEPPNAGLGPIEKVAPFPTDD